MHGNGNIRNLCIYGRIAIDGEGFLDQETRVLLRLKSSSHLYFFFQNAKKGKCKFKSKKNVGVIGVSLQTVANPPFFGIFLLQNNAVFCGRVVVVVVEPDLGKVQMLAREVVSLLPAADSSSSSS